MRRITALALSLLILLLSSCSFIQPTIEELMKPPKLSQQQMEVDAALKAALGTNSIKLKYPLSGDYRSAYVFYDIDSDGVEEAIVFYQPSLDESGTRINILDYQEGAWTSVYDVPGEDSAEVDYISFENIVSKDYKNIIIGWQPQNSKDKLISIYAYENQELRGVFDDKYNLSVVQDYNGDGLMDLLLISLRRSTVSLVTRREDAIRSVDRIDISQDIREVVQVLSGRLADGRQAVYLDVYLDGANYATEIIAVEDDALVPLIDISKVYSSVEDEASEEELLNFERTQRYERILSQDVNGDGIIDVPSSAPMLGYEELDESEQMFLTTYSDLRGGVLEPVIQASVNVEAGYLLRFPDEWLDSVSVVAETEVNQWRYIKFLGTLNDRSSELLRISRVSKNDYQDRFETDPVSLAQKGIYQYLGYLPLAGDRELSITRTELQQMFSLL